jgi:TolA-binding protein
MRYLNLVAIASLAAGCAAKGDVRRVETQLAEYRAEAARADSAHAAVLSRLLDEVARSHAQSTRLLDSLQAELQALNSVQGAVRGEVTEVQRQLATVRELTGQSQQGLNELRSEIERRAAPATRAVVASDSLGTGDPEADGLFEMGSEQLARGRPGAARMAFRRILEVYPEHPRVPDALYGIGESFRMTEPDSAVQYFEALVAGFPASPRAPLALYKIGQEAERRGDAAAARRAFERLVEVYPDSDEAALARSKVSGSRRQ